MGMETTITPTHQPIRQLAPQVIERIAAGETIERPASVVKELVENAIDAGARQITVELRGGGTRSIKVSDDGAGIPADELELAFARHATSKLRAADDLYQIGSLGFRGEALASIGAMGETLLISATGESGEGAGVLVSNGAVIERFTRARARGTTVTVRALFATVPARQKFLRPARTESAQISTIVRRYALGRPDIRFRLILDGHLSFASEGTGDLAGALAAVYGRQTRAHAAAAAGDGGGRGTDQWRHQRAATTPAQPAAGGLLRQPPRRHTARPGRRARSSLPPLLPARPAPARRDFH